MDKPCEEIAGYKHRSTNKFLNYFQKEIMDMCIQEDFIRLIFSLRLKQKSPGWEYLPKIWAEKIRRDKQKNCADGLKSNAQCF